MENLVKYFCKYIDVNGIKVNNILQKDFLLKQSTHFVIAMHDQYPYLIEPLETISINHL